MPIEHCMSCGHATAWSWEEAFCKFGFGDGDGLVMTETVADVLRQHGYDVTTTHWGFHNVIVTAISRDGFDQIPLGISLGYDDPRLYLPVEIVRLLDRELSEDRRQMSLL